MYRIHPDGTIETENAREAVELSRLMAAGRAHPPPTSPDRDEIQLANLGEMQVQAFERFLKRAKPHQRQLLQFLQVVKTATITEMRMQLGLPKNNSVTGTLLGIKRGLEKMGVDVTRVYTRNTASHQPMTGDDSSYSAQDLLMEASPIEL